MAVTYDAWNPKCSSSVLITASSGMFFVSYSSRIVSACASHSSLVLGEDFGLRDRDPSEAANAVEDGASLVIEPAASGMDSHGLGRSGRPPAEQCVMLRAAARMIAWDQ